MIKDVGTRLIAANPKGELAWAEGRRGSVEAGKMGKDYHAHRKNRPLSVSEPQRGVSDCPLFKR